jgi:hypothetical protein
MFPKNLITLPTTDKFPLETRSDKPWTSADSAAYPENSSMQINPPVIGRRRTFFQPALSQGTDEQVVECCDGVRLRPQTDAARCEPRVALVDQGPFIELPPGAVAVGDDAQPVPLSERRCLHPHANDVMAATVVVVEI